MFSNGQLYKQSTIPTPSGYVINPDHRNQAYYPRNAKTRFKTDGWFYKLCVPEGDHFSDIEFKAALFKAVKSSPTYVWSGDYSLIGSEYLARFSDIEETDNHFIEKNEHTTYDPDLGQWINYHWNRLSMMKGDGGVIYVFPHSLVYWVCMGKNVISKGLRKAVMKGKHVKPYELVENAFDPNADLRNFTIIWDEAENKERDSKESRTEPFNMEMPIQYQGDYPKKFVNAESWVNFGSNHQNGEYEGQSFYLPSPVDKKNLKALLSRQHIKHVALTYMANGFGQISEVCKVSPDLNRQLLVLFLNYRKYQKFAAYVKEKEGVFDEDLQDFNIDFPEKLKGLAPRLFPFTQEG